MTHHSSNVSSMACNAKNTPKVRATNQSLNKQQNPKSVTLLAHADWQYYMGHLSFSGNLKNPTSFRSAKEKTASK